MKRLLNDNWEFTKTNLGAYDEKTLLNDPKLCWEAVDLPHDFLIYQVKDLYENCEGWYRRKLTAASTKDRYLCLRFEGVYMDTQIFVNGTLAKEWKYGYSTFEVDLTDLVIEGDNEILVHITHRSPNSRWYSGAGIYRNVWLIEKKTEHIISDSFYISTEKMGSNFEVTASAIASSDGFLCFSIKDMAGQSVGSALVFATKNEEASASMTVYRPELWDIEIPHLYRAEVDLVVEGEVVDNEAMNIGFRHIEFTTDDGLYLNDKKIKLHGVCNHHDLGALGAAVNKQAIKRQLTVLRRMGVNALRTTHNMPSVELMDLADEMGFLVVSEGFDMWERPKTEFDYARFFPQWVEKDVKSWVTRDRNHPSLLMWSVGNEIYDTHADDHGQELIRMLMDLVLRYDPRKNAPATFGSNFMPWVNTQNCADIIKYAGYNYAEYLYEEHHKAHPDWYIYGSETASVVQSRGVYHFPAKTSILSDDDRQCSSLGNSTTSWGSKSHFANICDDRDATFSLGQFIWSGFDYIGEPTPYHTKNSYFGQVDTAGFEKDSYYIYQSEWTHHLYAPMIHIAPYWDFNPGQLIDVFVYSNAPKTELYLNDELVGTHTCDHETGRELCGHFIVPYIPGELRAIAYDDAGNELYETRRHSFSDAHEIVLTPDKTSLMGDGLDMIFVEIGMADADGYPVENANNRVEVSVTGAGRLVGLDNGDSTDMEEYKTTTRRLFGGKLLAMIAAKKESGDIYVTVTSKGMEAKTLTLYARPCDEIPGVSATMENKKGKMIDEIPIRKLEIIAQNGQHLTKENKKVTLSCNIHPSDATYSDLIWRATNEGGVDTNLAKLTVDPKDPTKCEVEALGDGMFYVRVATKNGKEEIAFYSQLEFYVEGLGQASLDPYQFISGSLYSCSGGKITSGNERGFASDRDGVSYVTFTNILFDAYGSDEITIPIFELESRLLRFEIWQGEPEKEGATCLGTYEYNKKTIWNVYQEETFRLPKRLSGMQTLSFRFDRKAHVKGFLFQKLQKAFATLSVLDKDAIYGDTFTICEDAITGIGNNVSIEFDDMDFGDQGAKAIVICGRSKLANNSIHVRFLDESGESKQIAEFAGCKDFSEQRFSLEPVTGKKKVTFIFLPGCDFDFKWFRFE